MRYIYNYKYLRYKEIIQCGPLPYISPSLRQAGFCLRILEHSIVFIAGWRCTGENKNSKFIRLKSSRCWSCVLELRVKKFSKCIRYLMNFTIMKLNDDEIVNIKYQQQKFWKYVCLEIIPVLIYPSKLWPPLLKHIFWNFYFLSFSFSYSITTHCLIRMNSCLRYT